MMTDKQIDALLQQLDFVEEHRGLVCRVLKYMGVRVRDVKKQAILASLYGALALYGVKGTVMIVLKLTKEAKAAPKQGPTP